MSAWGDVSSVRPQCDYKPCCTVPSHSLLGLFDNPEPSHTLSRFLIDTQPWQVTSQEQKSVLLSKWNSKCKKKRKWRQILPCATIWLSISLSTEVLLLILHSGIGCCICGHLSFALSEVAFVAYEFKKVLINLTFHFVSKYIVLDSRASCCICSNESQ